MTKDQTIPHRERERNQVRDASSDAADKKSDTSGLRPTCIEKGVRRLARDPALRETAARNGTITFLEAIERFSLK
ncbi:hypothetical protein CEXT_216021 [Caerostris extrusa]|uniref:Uncharacterized protein n=1 Tax=Caerostris extrusa TaxID=172846 RepID=A0AAV4SW14_CAEEX|nr:hypothetical protein CEXT_216021 [Caerostris extrusa]